MIGSYIMNGQIVYVRVHKHARLQIANRLHGKAAEQAVLTEIAVLKLKAHRVHLQ